MHNDVRVPKEQFLVDFFKSKNEKLPHIEVPFDSVLKHVQNKIDGKDLESLMGLPPNKAKEQIIDLPNKEIIPLVIDSADILKRMSKEQRL